MESVIVRAILAISALAAVASPQTAAPPEFEVAAIRPTDPGAPRNNCFMRGQPGGQTFVGRCIPLSLIIKYAYKIVDSQLTGGPAWMDRELYDFDAKTGRTVTRADLEPMFQKLIADRFKLKVHTESRTMSAYVLELDKGGNKMTPNDTTYEWEIPVTFVPATMLKVKGTRCPMPYLSWWIGQRENRPVVNKTGLAGFWDFTLEFVPEGMGDGRRGPNGEAAPPMEGPPLAVALREQLGLRLEPEKTAVDVYVIDRVEKASAN